MESSSPWEESINFINYIYFNAGSWGSFPRAFLPSSCLLCLDHILPQPLCAPRLPPTHIHVLAHTHMHTHFIAKYS